MRTLLLTLCGVALATASCITVGSPTPVPGLVNTIVVQTAQVASTETAADAYTNPCRQLHGCGGTGPGYDH